jgi:hypothetical protein
MKWKSGQTLRSAYSVSFVLMTEESPKEATDLARKCGKFP